MGCPPRVPIERRGGLWEHLRGSKVKMSLTSCTEPQCVQRFEDGIGDLHVESACRTAFAGYLPTGLGLRWTAEWGNPGNSQFWHPMDAYTFPKALAAPK